MKGGHKLVMGRRNHNVVLTVFQELYHRNYLIFPEAVAGVLFTDIAIPLYQLNHITYERQSISNYLKSYNQNEISNYILVIDYYIDFLKSNYSLDTFHVLILLHRYIKKYHIYHFRKLIGPITCKSIATTIIIDYNPHVFQEHIIKMFLWQLQKHIDLYNLSYWFLKLKISFYWKNHEINRIIYDYIIKDTKKQVNHILVSKLEKKQNIASEIIQDILHLIQGSNQKRH